MADFCKQCSTQFFGEDFGDLAGLVSQDDESKGLIYTLVLCEGCGPIQVDRNGTCVSPDCFEKHGDKNEPT